jgi:hypothetical protein
MKIRLVTHQKRRTSITVAKLYRDSDKAPHPVKNSWSITVFICDQDCFAGSGFHLFFSKIAGGLVVRSVTEN